MPTAELLSELKRRHELLNREPKSVALLGPPCAGKRSQADGLRRAFGLCRLSLKDLGTDAEAVPLGSTGRMALRIRSKSDQECNIRI